MTTNTTSYSVIADPHYRIVLTDNVLDASCLVATGTAHEMDRVMCDAYNAKVEAFEDAYEDHVASLQADLHELDW